MAAFPQAQASRNGVRPLPMESRTSTSSPLTFPLRSSSSTVS